ncbi:MAG: type II toxin-antitoxin system RelE/ParE family toxin [Flavobacteriia bacterium]|nr:type II toxin-antitoxin system RelE/ParE family toxin [Flavobacteriia bacterium]OIP48634.1 MAG: hypothetical protein AUK46_00625 [Flavobacteriaceae bacterium CG2_30_31_66]PIV95595.1 MAG: plasmid stabilization system [Flavobacteriaceae bacterium CG17_big_fil_post_rev_8_21_14_2_50_31_13]PIX12381.1 MAG: plasmid stabilization system [Flavobacteriaceae bacterium CG_4_8_14_3_um_filter_31_8]PIY15974.1 MAG: plasmid stabilization system [Flavobacteriaceae bacterium CG_4_10_14_3_um_filter_31_253]PIZ1
MGFKIVFEPSVYNEIEDAISYYESKQFELGEEFFNYLEGYFKTLENQKVLFEIKRKPVFRELPLKRFPFIIIYEILKNQVIIYSVFNTFQNPTKKIK